MKNKKNQNDCGRVERVDGGGGGGGGGGGMKLVRLCLWLGTGDAPLISIGNLSADK